MRKHLWRSSVQAPCQELGSPQQLAQDSIQFSFMDLQGWRLHNLSTCSICSIVWLSSLEKSVCLCVLKGFTEFPVFQLVPIASYPVTMNHWESGSINCSYTLLRSPLELGSSEWSESQNKTFFTVKLRLKLWQYLLNCLFKCVIFRLVYSTFL